MNLSTNFNGRDLDSWIDKVFSSEPSKWNGGINYSWKQMESGRYKCSVDTTGVSPEDISVEFVGSSIIIKGTSEYDGEKRSVNREIYIPEEVVRDINKLEYKTLNGITYIYAYTKVPEIQKVIPKRI